MARVKPQTLVSGRERLLQTGNTVEGSDYFYNGTSLKENPTVLTWTQTLTTDANGRVTAQVTADGLSTGTALLQAVYSISAIAITGNLGTASQNMIFTAVESVSANFKTIILRCAQGRNGTIPGGAPVLLFTPAGVSVYVTVIGNKL